MKIECTPQELKEIVENKKETPVAGTTDVKLKIDAKEVAKTLAECRNSQIAN